MKNKYTNSALKQGATHYTDYKGNSFIAVEKRSLNIFTAFKWLLLVVIILIMALYVFG